MGIEYTGKQLADYMAASDKNWILTNGLGGYASLTLGGGNTSKYNCLLSGAMTPPFDRYVLCSNIHEHVRLGTATVSLAAFDANGVCSQGNQYLKSFSMEAYPTYVYSIDEVRISKEITMIRGANATAVRYRITTGRRPVEMEFYPLINYRRHHDVSRRDNLDFDVFPHPGMVDLVYKGETEYQNRLHISYSAGAFETGEEPDYFRGMFYRQDADRCTDCWEDHFIPGKFVLKAEPRTTKTLEFVIFTEQGSTLDILKTVSMADRPDFFAVETGRRTELAAKCTIDQERAPYLAAGAEDYLVQDREGNTYIMAGYPWHGFRGRDAALAVIGLCISTGRDREAKAVLQNLVKYIDNSLLADNVDSGHAAEYDSADASLWLFEAVFEYYLAFGDREFVCSLRNVLESIIERYQQGIVTDRGVYIAMNSLGLIETSPGMTWMDARIDGKPITGREGCAVEINGLWYNALRIMEKLCPLWGDKASRRYDIQAILTRDSFRKYFVYEGGIADTVTFHRTYDGGMEPHRDISVRCNQMLALGLNFSPCDTETMKRCVRRVGGLLYTPVGIRTLSPDDRSYMGRGLGPASVRDYASYNGNSWTWLMGFYLRLLFRLGMYGKEQILTVMQPIFAEMDSTCLGHGGEMYQGDLPNIRTGDWAHALSDAEILRTLAAVCGIKKVKRNGKSRK